jgi:hypothetical protein
MTDYLRPVGLLGRRLALLACLVTTFVGATATAIAVAGMIQDKVVQHQGKPLWLGVGCAGLLTAAAGWLSVRLWSGALANGVTLMPVWFIEAFGALFLTAILWLLWTGPWRAIVFEAVSIGVAMLLIRRQVRRLREFASVGPGGKTTTNEWPEG